MAIQLSAAVQNARLDVIETTAGTAAWLLLYSGTPPTNAAAAATGTLLCQMQLPTDWMNAASAGAKTKLGTWSGTGLAAAGAGTAAGHFRIVANNAGSPNLTACHVQGTVTVTGGGGDMTLDNTSIALNQVVTVNTFSLDEAND